MKGSESTCKVPDGKTAGDQRQVARTGQHRTANYQKACDERKRPIRGLWIRNGRFYAQITLEDPQTGVKAVRRVPLESATTPAQAKAAMNELLVKRRKGQTIVQRRAPKFAEFAQEYLSYHRQAKDLKRASTLATEMHAINRLTEHLGHHHLDKLKHAHVEHFIAQRRSTDVSARTVNLEITVLRNVLKWARDRQLIAVLPTDNIRPLKSPSAKRQLVSAEAIEKLCAVAFEPRFYKGRLARQDEKGHPLLNGEQFVDYVLLMCYAGCRMAETLRLRWENIDWNKNQLTIGADGQTKNRQSRVVDFNEKLEAHLKDMQSRRLPGTDWLFPSPRNGEEDRPAKTFRESLRLARQAAGLPRMGFHDCRHFFISYCVMAGIDYLTIAQWVGHQDGGILIGRVYGHLSNDHVKRQAKKLNFGPSERKGDSHE